MSLEKCMLCPKKCAVNRTVGNNGICGMSEDIVVAKASLHMWEEPCISGNNGSGTVFFSGCALKCVFCQNKPVSRGEVGKKISAERLAEIYFELMDKGAANINLVTADHYIPQVAKSLEIARNNGMNLPIVYNTSSYINVGSLSLLNGLIDIYLPDMKYMNPMLAAKYSFAFDYPGVAKKAIDAMVNQVGKPIFDENGMMKKGVIVRHLVLPGNILDSKKVLRYLFDTYGDNIYISIMSQYTPCTNLEKYPEINRKLTKTEYDRIVDFAENIGIVNAFIQDGEAASESFIPSFDCDGV